MKELKQLSGGWKMKRESELLERVEDLISNLHSIPENKLKTSVRSIQDYITLLQNGGGWKMSKIVEGVLKSEGVVKRNQVVWEHKTPLNTYFPQFLEILKEGDSKKAYQFLYEKTDYVLVHRVEDLMLSLNGYTSKLPTEGIDRYDASGITLSDRVLKIDELNTKEKMTRANKVKIARQEFKTFFKNN